MHTKDLNHYVSVKEASLICYEMGLPRSTKSMRRWCTKEEVEAQKKQTSHGEKWFINRDSLEIKIKEELEFLKHSEKSLPRLDQAAEPTADKSGQERTQADMTAYERTGSDASAHGADMHAQTQIRDLQDQILLLKKDVEWRNQLLKDQKNTNLLLMDEVKGQSRYIGHLETNVLQLGGKTDQAFLAAPVPKSGVSEHVESGTEIVTPEVIQNERPHPDQSGLYTG